MVSLISKVDTTHRDMIHDAQMDYYGTRLATCSSDRSIKIFEVKPNGQSFPVTELTGHEGPVWQVAWSHPMFESLLASCSYDHKVIIWKITGNKWSKVYESTAHDSSVNSVCWAPYQLGCMLACASTDKSISILSYSEEGNWEVKKIENAHEQGCNAVSFAPPTSPTSLLQNVTTPLSNPRRIVSGGNDNQVKIWKEDEEGKWVEEKRLEGHSDWVRDVAWAPFLGQKHTTIASASQDKKVFIWKCGDLEKGLWESAVLHSFDDAVWHVSWSQCGSVLAVSGGDNKVSLWKENLEGEWICISDSQKANTNQKSR